ncbi:MAG: pilus assembly protein [Kordiimonadaceae bacterium]|nr:pilus assembly protein [Kordiimonadaceae bacterium]
MIKNIKTKLLSDERGASLVEMALILPILLLLMVGSLDLGSAFVRKMELSNAAKAGIQYAMVRKPVEGDVTAISNAVTESIGDTGNDTTDIDVELYCMCDGAKQLCTNVCADENVSAFVNVTVTENYTTPYFNYNWLFSEFPLKESQTIQLN